MSDGRAHEVEMDAIAVLLIEDDARLGALTAGYLRQGGLQVTHEVDGAAGLEEAVRRRYDAVVLDVVLPTRDGVSVCSALRAQSDVPIIFTTARVEEADLVLGLESGADDHLAKPFSPRELLARIRAVVRRSRGQLIPKDPEWMLGPLRVSSARREVRHPGGSVLLSSSEFDLLVVFLRNRGRVLSREQLLRMARGSDSDSFERAIDVQVSRLRQKLASAAGTRFSPIRTVRGVGYQLLESE